MQPDWSIKTQHTGLKTRITDLARRVARAVVAAAAACSTFKHKQLVGSGFT